MFSKWQDTSLGKYKVDGDVTIASVQASTQTLIAFKDDIGVRFCRDLIMAPGSVWCGLYMWDKIVDNRYPWLVWNVAKLDGPLEALPLALLTFFFGLAAMNIWKRR